MELRDYLRVLQRRWLLVVVVTAGVTGIGYYYVQREPTVYTARAEILIRDNPYFFQAGEYQALFPDYFSKATRTALLRNRPILEHAVRNHLQRYFPRALAEDAAGRQAMMEAVLSLRTSLAVSQEKDMEIITVSYTDLDGQRAVDVVNAVVLSFEVVSRERQEEGVKNAIGFIGETLKDREVQRKRLAERLRALGPPPTESLLGREEKALLDELNWLQERATEMRSKIDGLRSENEILSSQLDRPPAARGEEKPRDGELIELRDQLRRKQSELRALRRKWEDSNPVVRRLLEEIAVLETQYADALEREVRRDLFEAQQALIERIRGNVLEQRKIEASVAQNELAQAATRAKYQELLQRKPDPRVEEELKREAERSDLTTQIKALEDGIQSLGRTRDSLVISIKKIVSAAERLETAHHAVPAERRGFRNLPLVALSGLILGIAAAFLIEHLNTSIRTEHDVKRYVNLPLLGAVPRIRNEAERLLVQASPKSPLGEVFNAIASMIEAHARDSGSRTFMVASSNAGEGKSTVTANIGIALARGGARVLLVDADLRKAVLHRFFGVQSQKGLSNYLAHRAGAAEEGEPATTIDEIIHPTQVENLNVVTAGFHPKNPVNLLKSEGFKAAIEELKSRADYVLVDVPPVRIAVDTLVLAPIVENVVLLVSAGETNKDDVGFAKRLLEMAKGKMVGCILNKMTIQSRGYYYYYYHYYDAYRYYRES
ncbi:MAG: polysaccharide biosynthesis tyrosine autokinase [Planctomycetes bacterium]|nr:polysaccharide biosynthesis tyrosine autokinase [Planctomycetota bacterium]